MKQPWRIRVNTSTTGDFIWEYTKHTVTSRVVRYLKLQWCHNECNDISNCWCLDYLVNRLLRCRSKKNQHSQSMAFVRGIHQWPVNSPHTGPGTRKMFPLDDVIMNYRKLNWLYVCWFRLTTKITTKLYITNPLWRNPHWLPVDSPHKGPAMPKEVFMSLYYLENIFACLLHLCYLSLSSTRHIKNIISLTINALGQIGI